MNLWFLCNTQKFKTMCWMSIRRISHFQLFMQICIYVLNTYIWSIWKKWRVLHPPSKHVVHRRKIRKSTAFTSSSAVLSSKNPFAETPNKLLFGISKNYSWTVCKRVRKKSAKYRWIRRDKIGRLDVNWMKLLKLREVSSLHLFLGHCRLSVLCFLCPQPTDCRWLK